MADFQYEESFEVPPQIRKDGWSNIKSGLGTSKDKRSFTSYDQSASSQMIKEDFITIYSGDGLVKRIVDMLPEDMTRQWGHFCGDPKDEHEEGTIAYQMNKLQVPEAFKQAKKWARLTGGALVYIVVTGAGAPTSELKGPLKKSAVVEGLRVFDLGDIMTSEFTWELNPNSPNFGKVKYYRVKVRAGNDVAYQTIHASRCIPFFGEPMPSSYASGSNILETRYWGASVLRFLFDDIADFRAAFGHVGQVLHEFIIGKYKFADLDEMLAFDNGARLRTRMAAIDLTKSTINSVMIGTDEDYTRDTAAMGGISDILDRFMMLVSASTGYPVTKLFGRSAAGMSATGEGDMANYNDLVRSAQNELTMYIEQFGQMIADWQGIDEDIHWEWNPLQQATEEQKQNAKRITAETERTLSDAYARMVDAMVLSPEEVRLLLFKDKLEDAVEASGEGEPPEPLESPVNKETTLKPPPPPVIAPPAGRVGKGTNPNTNGGTPPKAKGIDKNGKGGGPNGTFTA